MSNSSITEQVFLVTGAASGIGRELALQAAAAGSRVIAVDIKEAELAETVRLMEPSGALLLAETLDVADATAIRSFTDRVLPLLNNRRLVLINNAGTSLSSGTFGTTELADFEWVMNVNLWGAIRLTKAFLPYLMARNEGHIVNISSVFGLIGVAENAPYCTSKFALRGFTESLRMELRRTGISTTSVHPGGIRTNIVRYARLANPHVDQDAHQRSVAVFEKNARTSPASAARQILRAVEKRQERLVIGADGKAIDLMARLLPVAYTGIVLRKLKKTFGAG